jgi:RNA polymerase sigma factor (sigma-70 family)
MDTPFTRKELLGLNVQYYDEPEFHDGGREPEIVSPMPGQVTFDDDRIDLVAKARAVPPELRFVYSEPLLNREQERHLFRLYNFHKCKAKEAIDQIKDGRSHGAIQTANSEWYKAGRIKGQVVCSNTRLVLSICKKQKHYNDSPSVDRLIELMSDGSVGLVRAVDYFDYRLGNKFSTYATWAILDTIKRAKISGDRHAANFVNGFEELLHQQFDRDHAEPFLDSDFVAHILATLKPKLRKVLCLYFGINRRKNLTLQEIAMKMGLSKERVRQLRDRALQELRGMLSKKSVYRRVA